MQAGVVSGLRPLVRFLDSAESSWREIVMRRIATSTRFWLFALGVAIFSASMSSALAEEIKGIEWTPTVPGAAPALDAKWTTLALPLRWMAQEDASLQGVALRAKFTLTTAPDEAWAILLRHATDGGRISVNGRFIGAIRTPSPEHDVRWRRPHLLAIDPSLLVAGENIVLIQTSYRSGSHGLAGVEVGTLADMSLSYERQFFLSSTLTWIGATMAGLITLLFGVLWLRRPDRLLGLLTLASALWVFRSTYFLVESMPIQMRFWLGFVYYASSGGFATVMTLALMRLSGRRERRDELFSMGFIAVGLGLYVAAAQAATPYLDQYWIPGLIAMAGIAWAYALICRLRGKEAPNHSLLLAMAIALGAAVHDYLLTRGQLLGTTMLALHWAGPLLLVALATPLVDRFVRVLREAETARAELESRVREREQLLKRNYERLRESERLQAIAAERSRIMQDMHDGLGSQLLSSLMLVERGAVSNDQVAQILRESIDDMRLAIDAIAVEDAGLLSALGNLRFRMEPRMRAAGMELVWDARGLPEELDINPDAVLPILRIVQEALTNALKHSRARIVQVLIAIEKSGSGPDWVSLRVADNGRGITEERVGGRGLINMRNRAARISAFLKLDTVPGAGTVVGLRFRVEPSKEDGESASRVPPGGLNTEAVIERVRRQ